MNVVDRKMVDGIRARAGKSIELGEPDADGRWTLEIARSRLHGVAKDRDDLLRIVAELEAEIARLRATP